MSSLFAVQDSNQSPNFNSDKCPWSIKNCQVTGTGMSMSVTGKLIDQGVSDIQYLIYSEYGSSLFVSSAGKNLLERCGGVDFLLKYLQIVLRFSKPIFQKICKSCLWWNSVFVVGKPTARLYRKNEWVWKASSDVDVVYGSWVHWMMTWSANDGVKLYINGEQAVTNSLLVISKSWRKKYSSK